MSDNCQTETATTPPPSESPNLRDLFASASNSYKDDSQEDDNSNKEVVQPPSDDYTPPPKAGQKYWLSSEAKRRKNIYMRDYYQRKKEELIHLQEHQIKPRDIQFIMCNNQVYTRHLETDNDYRRLIVDLLGTLQDNKLVLDFTLQ